MCASTFTPNKFHAKKQANCTCFFRDYDTGEFVCMVEMGRGQGKHNASKIFKLEAVGETLFFMHFYWQIWTVMPLYKLEAYISFVISK